MRKRSGMNLPTLISLDPSEWRSEITANASDQLPARMKLWELAEPAGKGRPNVKHRPGKRGHGSATQTGADASAAHRPSYSILAALAASRPYAGPQTPFILQAWDNLMRLLRGVAVLLAIVIVGAEVMSISDPAPQYTRREQSVTEAAPAPVIKCSAVPN